MLKFINITLSTLLFIFINAANGNEKEAVSNQFDSKLYSQLPAHIQESKKIVTANDGSVPPYIIYDEHSIPAGATIDLFNAIGEVLGVKIEYQTTNGISGVLMGIQSGNYDLGIGPIGDSVARQVKHDFVDYAISYEAFAVRKGNPENIHSMADTCGKRVAVTIGGAAVDIFNNYSEQYCLKEGKPPVDVLSFKDQPTATLAVRSGRADAFYNGISMLAYFVASAKDELELAGTVRTESDPKRYYAAVVNKNSPLAPIILSALQQLFDNGTYNQIMNKWNLETSTLAAPGINLTK